MAAVKSREIDDVRPENNQPQERLHGVRRHGSMRRVADIARSRTHEMPIMHVQAGDRARRLWLIPIAGAGSARCQLVMLDVEHIPYRCFRRLAASGTALANRICRKSIELRRKEYYKLHLVDQL